ncbi:hypothetical protein [Sulfuriflexus sp.]|uniref:hypothetical protein n=1 Tax=Sulfuriflexus sp. TaxID=2015443 RepID=UPI0028CEDD60|nr:hypothetical protein [Sulfuriflexus sp.]MDT8404152.1 hypothetical protein [Sulfuriflexus sp.]
MLRKFRILIALLVLLFVASSAALTRFRTTNWDRTLYVSIYPINGDQRPATRAYINSLSEASFADIEQYLARQALAWRDLQQKPFDISLAPEVTEKPPMPPQGGNALQIMYWSLKMRYWAWTHNSQPGPAPDIQLYTVYYDPAVYSQVGHSFGLQKGLVGIVNAFASRAEGKRNNVIIAHELLHTLGATDKYDPANNQPLYPLGFADPEQQPLYPQKRAELMGGRIPLSPQQARQPDHLRQTLIGNATAIEIGLAD